MILSRWNAGMPCPPSDWCESQIRIWGHTVKLFCGALIWQLASPDSVHLQARAVAPSQTSPVTSRFTLCN